MKANYNYEEQYVEQVCGCCGHVHREYWKNRSETHPNEKTEPFIKCETDLLCTEEVSYGPDRLVKKTMYVCPTCGMVQVEV